MLTRVKWWKNIASDKFTAAHKNTPENTNLAKKPARNSSGLFMHISALPSLLCAEDSLRRSDDSLFALSRIVGDFVTHHFARKNFARAATWGHPRAGCNCVDCGIKKYTLSQGTEAESLSSYSRF